MEAKIQFKNTEYDMKIKEIENHSSNGLDSHYLNLLFEGDDFNPKIVNMIRRVCTNDIPVYAYAPGLINIIENTSIAFNNDMMKLDLSLLPIYDIDPDLYELDDEYWYNVNYSDKERKRHPNEKTIEFFLSYHNNSSDIVRVTTNDAQIYVNGEQVEMYDKKYPISLIKLKGNQSFKCHMRGVLGTAERRDDGALWKSCKRVLYWPTDKGEYEFKVFGNEMYSEYNLLIKSCKFIISKLEKIKKMILDKEIVPERTIEFILENEDHTMGEPINYELQDHEDITFSGFSKADHLIKTGVIKASCVKTKESPIGPLIDSIDRLIGKTHKMGYLLTELSGSQIKQVKDSKKEQEGDRKKKHKHKK